MKKVLSSVFLLLIFVNDSLAVRKISSNGSVDNDSFYQSKFVDLLESAVFLSRQQSLGAIFFNFNSCSKNNQYFLGDESFRSSLIQISFILRLHSLVHQKESSVELRDVLVKDFDDFSTLLFEAPDLENIAFEKVSLLGRLKITLKFIVDTYNSSDFVFLQDDSGTIVAAIYKMLFNTVFCNPVASVAAYLFSLGSQELSPGFQNRFRKIGIQDFSGLEKDCLRNIVFNFYGSNPWETTYFGRRWIAESIKKLV